MFSFIRKTGFKPYNARKLMPLQPITPVFRAFCNSPQISLSESLLVYKKVIATLDSDNISLEDTINKGFAYLLSNKNLSSWSAWEYFNKAIERGGEKDYKEIIDCGMRLVRGEQGEKSYYVIKKSSDGTFKSLKVLIDDGVAKDESTHSVKPHR